ncbi:MAG: STAS domain-containing protein [Vicinamibacterales bacterium]
MPVSRWNLHSRWNLQRSPMQIDERTVENVMILDLKGKLICGSGDALLKDKIHSLVHQGHKQILLNFGDLSYMDSPGLGEIVAGYTTVSRAGGSLKLLNLTKRIPALLAITKLLTVFETFQGEQEAVRSFSSPTV